MYCRLKKLCFLIFIVCLSIILACIVIGCSGRGADPQQNNTGTVKYAEELSEYKKSDWSAKWIWTQESQKNTFVAFRKTFTLDKVPASAVANIAAENKYVLWVNSEIVVYEGQLKRGATSKDGYYEQVDLAPYLKAGDNVIAVLVIYYGESGYSHVDSGRGGFLMEADIGTQKLITDSSFKVKRLDAYKNKTSLGDEYASYKEYGALSERHVYYDARDSIGEWFCSDFDDSLWENAFEVCKGGETPFNDLYKRITPAFVFDKQPTAFVNAFDYLNKEFENDTTIELQLPKNMQFSVCFELTAGAGKKIRYYSDTFSCGANANSFRDDYITMDGFQSYENYPWRSGHKLIMEVPSGVTFTFLGYRASGYDSTASGGFQTDDEDINVLWEKAVNTLQVTMRDTYMDCPDRERAPYIGDTVNEMSMAYYSLDTNAYALAQKAILTTVGWVGDNDVICSCVPGQSGYEFVAQNLAFIAALPDYILYTGDIDTVKIFYKPMVSYLKLWSVNDNGLPEIRRGTLNNWEDWGENPDKVGLQTCWYYYALTKANEIASTLNITTDEEFFTTRIDSIKKGFAKYKTEKGYKTDGAAVVDERLNALAVVSGLADESEYDKIYALLTDPSAYASSPYMEKYCEEALCILGDYDAAKARIKVRYSEMLVSDYTTLWEYFDLTGTINHAWSGGYVNIIGKYFYGIRPLTNGYDTYEIAPKAVFEEMSINVDTVRGKICFSAKKSADAYVITVTSPSGGVLKIPEEWGSNITISGDGTLNGSTVMLNGGTCTVTVKR